MKLPGILEQPSDLERWSRLAEEIGGQFWAATHSYITRGGIGHVVHLKVEQWSVLLEAFKEERPADSETGIEQVRMRAPYEDKDGFRFSIYRAHALSGIGKLFGAQDVETGDPAFDDEFVIKSNDEAKARDLFASARVRQLIRAQPYVRFQAADGEGSPASPMLGSASAELYFLLRDDQSKEIALLKGLFELFAETLRQLRAVGSA